MDVKMGAFDLSKKPELIKLNNAIATSKSAKEAIVKGASQARSSGSASHIFTSSYRSASSGSSIFTPSLRRPRITSMGAAVGLSRALNNGRPNYRYAANLMTTGVATQSLSYTQQGPSTIETIGEIIGAASSLFTAGVGAYKEIKSMKSDTNSKKVDRVNNALSDVPSNKTDANGAIDKMKQCKDSTSLRSAIASANQELDSMDSNIATLNQKVEEFNKAKEGLTEQAGAKEERMKNLSSQQGEQKSVVNKTKDSLNKAQAREKTADETLTKADSNYKEKTGTYEKAKERTKAAETGVSTAETNLANAKAKLADARKVGPDGTQDMKAIADAKLEVEAAEEKLEQAKTERQSAQKAEKEALTAKQEALQSLTSADKDVQKAKQEATAAMDEVQKQEDQLIKFTKELDETEKDMRQVQSELDDVTSRLDAGNSQAGMLAQQTESRKELSSAIEKYNRELTKLESKELKEADKQPKKQGDGVAHASLKARKSDINAINDKIDEYSKRDQSDENHFKVDNVKYYKITNGTGQAGQDGQTDGTGNVFYYRSVGGGAPQPITKSMFDEAKAKKRS